MKIVLAILSIAAINLGCGDPNKFTSESGDPHATKIIVKLTGTYAADEVVDVTIGTGGVTTIGKDMPPEAYATVDPGTYTIVGIPRGVEGSWTHTTKVEEGQQKTITLPCNDATLIVKPDPLWVGTHNRFRITIYTVDGHPSFIVGAGETGSYKFRPGKTGNQIHIQDADTGEPLITTVIKVFYDGTLTYTIPY
jgi:hypothetical protein